MKSIKFNRTLLTRALLLSLSLVLLTGCASTQTSSDGAIQARNDLTTLQQDTNLGNRARNEMAEAEQAVQLAEEPVSEPELNEHRVYLANQKIEIARAKATANYSEEQRKRLAEERNEQRLQQRTAEADRARSEANRSRSSEAELQRQLAALQAESTDRGIVLTLGDVLFASGSAELQAGADANLKRLTKFLEEHPERKVKIEGHTDSTGNPASNQELSKNRADSVRSYLTEQGIAANRLTTSGLGQDRPIADNGSSLGRQQNRRVEVIIENSPRTKS